MERKYPGIIIALTILLGLVVSLPASGQNSDEPTGFRPDRVLYAPHAALDTITDNIYLVSNSWRTIEQSLRRFTIDGEPTEGFYLQRFETCCAIRPTLAAVDSEGNIYTLEFTNEIGKDFNLYKHGPSGEIDVDWGSGAVIGDYSSEDESVPESEYSTSLIRTASGGLLQLDLDDPIDMIARSDGSLLILDRFQRYVFEVSPDGTTLTEFIGASGYYPNSPQRLIQDSDGNLYMVDIYDYDDFNRRGEIGVQKFTPDGEWIYGWGEGIGYINEQYRESMDFTSMVIDGAGNLMILGGEAGAGNHSHVFIFDRETGIETWRDNVQYRNGYDENYLGILGRRDAGFIHLEKNGFTIYLNFYSLDGILEHAESIEDLYTAD